MKKMIYCTTQFEGFHAYPNAPEGVEFLRTRHRHVFHVKFGMSVSHDDREVEFILLKREVDEYIRMYVKERDDVGSCEMLATELIEEFSARYGPHDYFCEVSEDGENGAIVHAEHE